MDQSIIEKENIKKIVKHQIELEKNGITPLYHGVSFQYVNNIFKNGFLECRTPHRYWSDGLRRKDDNEQYEDSYWKVGTCFSRNFEIALNFGGIVFVVDKNKLKQNFKIEPIAWNYHISSKSVRMPNHKKEREEFLIGEKTNICLKKIKEEKDEIMKEMDSLEDLYFFMPENTEEEKSKKLSMKQHIDKLYDKLSVDPFDLLKEVRGNIDLDKYMIGFYLNKSILDIYKNNSEYQKLFDKLKNHEKFFGFLNEEPISLKQKNKRK